MSSVLALKRSNSTVRYCFEADAEPGVLPRALELIAKRGLVPARVFAQADAEALNVEIEVEGLEPETAEHVGRCLSEIVGVRQTF
jgi:acetolactate synthase regulatory subunit